MGFSFPRLTLAALDTLDSLDSLDAFASSNSPQPLAQDAVVHGDYRCGEGHGRNLPALTLGQRRKKMIPKCPLITMRHDQFTITKGWHLMQKFVAGNGSLPIAHVMAKDQERGIHDGAQRIRRRSRKELLDPCQNPVVVGKNDVLFGTELAEERASTDSSGIGEVVHGGRVVALPHQ